MKLAKASIFLLGLLVVIATFTGCTQTTSGQSPQSKKSMKVSKKLSEKLQTPEETVLNNIERLLPDYYKSKPTKDSIIWSIQIGKQAIVLMKAPNTSLPVYNTVELFNDNGYWHAWGTSSWAAQSADAFKLDIPLQKGTQLAGILPSILSGDVTVLYMADGKNKFAAIARVPRELFTPSPGMKEIDSNSEIEFLNAVKRSSSFYYFEGSETVLVSGNLSGDELLKLALSLPPVTSEFWRRGK